MKLSLMPFKSKAQREWMHANHPEMAAQWEKDSPKGKTLPEHVREAYKRAGHKGSRKGKKK